MFLPNLVCVIECFEYVYEMLDGGACRKGTMIQRVNRAGLEVMYVRCDVSQDPKPHVSIAWALGDRTEQLRTAIAALHKAGGRAGVACHGLQWSCQAC